MDWVEEVAYEENEETEVAEVCIIELGGTVGDIESAPFVEAMRQFQFRVGNENFCQVGFLSLPCLALPCLALLFAFPFFLCFLNFALASFVRYLRTFFLTSLDSRSSFLFCFCFARWSVLGWRNWRLFPLSFPSLHARFLRCLFFVVVVVVFFVALSHILLWPHLLPPSFRCTFPLFPLLVESRRPSRPRPA